MRKLLKNINAEQYWSIILDEERMIKLFEDENEEELYEAS